jgi:predicted ferric reductase
MNYSAGRAMRWLGIYFILAMVPMLIALVDPPPARSVWVELGVGFGFIGLSVLALQFLCSGRIKHIAPEFGADNILHYHRTLGIIGITVILAHPAVLILSELIFTEPAATAAELNFLGYFDPRVNALRAVSLIFVVAALIILLTSSLWRPLFKLSYEWWRLLHGGLSAAIVILGLGHAFMVDHYLDPFWKKVIFAIMIGAMVYLVLHTRIIRPWLMKKRLYRVLSMQPERADSWTLTLRPESRTMISFIPGQFAWITIGNTPFQLQQHPFSFSSSARSRTISFTAKETGDFTSQWKHIRPGTNVFLEGPFGSFTPDPSPKIGFFFIMGGIGITPAISMLRTMHDDNDRRPAILLYGNPTWEEVTFREELDILSKELNLQIIHVLQQPPENWEGETGLISPEIIKKYFPKEPHRFQYFICGPEPMMDIAEISLRNLKVDWRHIYTERFEIV